METTNLSKIRREKMLCTISDIKKNITDENVLNNLSLIENELTKKKYGLIWEEHMERVDKELETQIPTFDEIKDKQIKLTDKKYNFLLEGDNLHSLYLLEKTHKEKIDLIYIDPPYNTGNRDFIYDDKMIDNVDTFKHSKWLSFMNRRLQIAKRLLSNKGLIFISIDDNEVAQLKLLCNDIFGDNNFKGQIVRRTGTPTGQGNNIISNELDYILVYSKTSDAVFNGLPFEEDDNKIYNLEDEYGRYLNRPLRKTGGEDRKEDRPSMYYGIEAPDGTVIYPIAPSGYESRWRCSEKTYNDLKEKNRIEWKKQNGEWKVYQKFYLEGRLKQPSNLWIEIEGNKKATITLKNILSEGNFDFPKPVELIKRIIKIASNKKSVILDFFAGSGTTGQAVLEVNNEDGGERNFIICTNNENNICEKVTYQRLRTVITGKRNNNSKYSDGLSSNLKYYKTAYVPRINTDEGNLSKNLMVNIKKLIQLENGIEIDDKMVRVILTEEEIDKFTINEKELNECEKLYISSDILLTSKQNKIFNDYNIELFIIPEYYFEDEIREVA